MTFILTFLGKGGTGRTTVAIAAARRLAAEGKRVLLLGQDTGPAFGLLVGMNPGPDPQELVPNLQIAQLHSAAMLEHNWEEIKRLEAEYLRTPTLKSVYGQELGVLPGMDGALALNAIREYSASQTYDAIVYDGTGDQATLRMLGTPEVMSWYVRRFRQVFADSDFAKTMVPLLQPIVATLFNVDWLSGNFSQPTNQVNTLLDQGKDAVSNPEKMAAYLVTTADPMAIATARYLWGAAQQVNLTIGGVILNQATSTGALVAEFAPLPVNVLPSRTGADWQALMAALPDFHQATQAPRPMTINLAERKVRLFLPGFDKTQVKLSQNGPEVTIEAGDQRHNILLPPELSGKPVTGAKFQDSYLTISF
ncbi:arsenic-transporting ATPase [Leptolyngbya sp. 'hensonii']|uniref:Get3/ArsA fold putative tail anchor-mediating ATPase NosAFP n=1 Tax=Leptolyngbya sp. 'hensonii' TaxID=1922337 RepID=UPI00094F8FDC|nr:ArsA family ATPase [Leptolyngbya sp. 'hensonii']OLP16512.1 arsenic-transporting ATPase [Leptolyngbya sp. 'hensonii']